MKGMNAAHKAAKEERHARRKEQGRRSYQDSATPAVKKKSHPTNTPKVIALNYSCPAPTAWQKLREGARAFNHVTLCFEYFFNGKLVTRKELRGLTQ